MILLDTHAAIWLTVGQLGKQSRRIADKALADDGLAISTISFWELSMLIAKGRLRARSSPREQRTKMLAVGIQELPVTSDVAILAGELENLHGDPADRIIAATAIAHGATLMTADSNLLQWSNPLTRQDAEQ